MEGRWERYGVGFLKWVMVPLLVFGVGLFLIGPRLGGPKAEKSDGAAQEPVLSNTRPIEPGLRKWKPVSPPQVSITVEPKEVPEVDPLEDEMTPPIEIPEGARVDEAGVGGMTEPPTTTGGDGSGDATTGGGAFRGIGGRG